MSGIRLCDFGIGRWPLTRRAKDSAAGRNWDIGHRDLSGQSRELRLSCQVGTVGPVPHGVGAGHSRKVLR